MMRLSAIVEGFAPLPGPDPEIGGMTLDSRQVAPGDLFVALSGTHQDGARFIPQAIEKGCAAVLVDADRDDLSRPSSPVPQVAVPRLRENVGEMASRFFGEPSRRLTVIGVTGTNGKSSFVHLLSRALNRRVAAGSIGTLGAGAAGREARANLTTPDAIGVHRALAAMAAEGVQAVAMEVSSHALDQHRTAGVQFKGAAFTNLSRDHLDYHGDMESYANAKARLMAWHGLEFVILNADDPVVNVFRRQANPTAQLIEYGMHGGSIRADEIDLMRDGARFRLTTPQGSARVRSQLLGRFNVYNLLAVAATLFALGWELGAIASALGDLEPVPGRVNALTREGRPVVVVDYAHTPDALEQCLRALHEHGYRHLVCVFGCGGDRDRGKRPLMAAAAENHADRIIVTDDNPRGEDGDRIVEEILDGFRNPESVQVIRDRRRAIETAISEAQVRDAVLIAGKGHEDYQEIDGERRPFDDRKVALAALEGHA